ncbi:MAG TPA: hypothetical protein VNO33_06075 [Kofleriaceae bacterium]|nr:hypothetical protein [Kofleriaceae bacterium]
MGALVGFVVGYVLGARQGPETNARLRQAVDSVLGSPEFKAMVDRGAELSRRFTGGPAGAKGNGQSDGMPGGNGQTVGWRAIAESEAVQTALATGLSFASDLFDRGMAMLQERRGRSQ